MHKNLPLFLTTGMALVAAWGFAWVWAWVLPRPVQGQTKGGYGFAAVPGEKGGWDLTGPYQVVPGWPKPMSKFRPRAGANPDFLVGKPVYAAWK